MLALCIDLEALYYGNGLHIRNNIAVTLSQVNLPVALFTRIPSGSEKHSSVGKEDQAIVKAL